MADAGARDPVECLLEEFLQARRRGESVDLAAHVARAGARAGELRQLIDSAVLLEDLKAARPRGLSLQTPQVFGDYRIVAEIGRGGMGVVYEAEQMTLQRRVALKVLPPQALRSESRLQRFKREAQTAGKLHHTNIVPIFGVGEQDGVHYFVMQLIVGRALDDVIRALRGEGPGDRAPTRPRSGTQVVSASSAAEALRAGAYAPRPVGREVGPGDAAYYRSVASLGLQVADALTYAHAQGTLHRDIKPANLILDGHGVLWVTDFGLAKVMEDDTFTHSGDVVGTLQYMAPEQFGGQADARTDVHGLGLVLYELATLRPAFAADSRGELIDRVKNHDPTPPSKVRAGVPRDLDTIIGKATAKDPAHRYQTAVELRDDLERFLQDRPIRARPVSVVESAWRWCRRNRMLASAGVLAVLGLVSTVVATALGYWSTRRALDRAMEATALAEANVATALQGYEDLFAAAVGPELLRTEDEDEGDVVALEATLRMSEDTERILQRMLVTYDKLAAANQGNAAARQLTARAYYRVGEIHRQLRKWPEAIANYERACALYRELVDSGDVGPGVWMQVQNGLCRTLWDELRDDSVRPERDSRKDVERARQHRAWAEKLGREVIAFAPDNDAALVRFERARAHDLLGSRIAGRAGRGQGRTAREDAPRDGAPPREAGAREPRESEAMEERVAHHRAALALNEVLLAQDPTNPAYRQATARSRSLLARALRHEAPEEAARLHGSAVAALEELVAQDRRASYRVDLIQALTARGARGRGEEHLSAARRVNELFDSLARDFPGNERYQFWAVMTAVNFARDLAPDVPLRAREQDAARHAEAAQVRQAALVHAERLAAARPTDRSSQHWIAELRVRCALDQVATDPEGALARYRSQLREVEALADAPGRGRGTALQLRVAAARAFAAAQQPAVARAELDELLARLGPTDAVAGWPGRLESAVRSVVEVLEFLGDSERAAAVRQRFPVPSRRERDG